MNELIGLAILIVLSCVYFAPAIIASRNKRKNANAISVVNVFLGWTLIGWVIALAWSVVED